MTLSDRSADAAIPGPGRRGRAGDIVARDSGINVNLQERLSERDRSHLI
jgi:hypothetical protein